jgi:hypothetical protein
MNRRAWRISSLTVRVAAALCLARCSAGARPPLSPPLTRAAPNTPRATVESNATSRGAGGDPAGIDGRWLYRTRTNCNTIEGFGEVQFTWNPTNRTYKEQGSLYWSDLRKTFTWWGTERYYPETRHLQGDLRNSLGDTVVGRWRIEETRPVRLVLTWRQSNGCFGEGTALRGGGLLVTLTIRRWTQQLQTGSEIERVEAARALGEIGPNALPAIPALTETLGDSSSAVRAAAASALERIRQ